MDDRMIAHQAMEEHERLDREVAKLRDCLSAERPAHQWFHAAYEKFRPLHTQLRKHMEMEEQGGFMQPVRQRRPTLSPRVERLLQEHRDIIAECNAIEMMLEHGTKEPTDHRQAEVRTRIDGLLDALQRHERDENHLVQIAFNLDLGAGD